MSIKIPNFYSRSPVFLIILLIASLQVAASQTEPLTDHPAPSFHPGLFSKVSSGQEPIQPVVNTYEDADASPNITPTISYSFNPGDVSSGKKPSVNGFISGVPLNTSVNITGRKTASEPFRYLASVHSDEKGYFIWILPEWASGITEVMVGITQ